MLTQTASTQPDPQAITDVQKIQIVHAMRAVHREWVKGDLSPEEKRYVLEGMDIGTDEAWVLELIADVRQMRLD